MTQPDLKISVCCYQDGTFDVMLRDPETGREVCLSGHQEVSADDLDLINDLAPPCVWTDYVQI